MPADFSLHWGGDANMLFGTKFLPIISNEDPIIGKLIRLAHLGELEGKGAMHRTTSGTIYVQIAIRKVRHYYYQY